MDHPIISCDDHLDLNMLPADLWTSGLPDHLKDRAPHIEFKDGRAMWVCEGESWGSWAGHTLPDAGAKPILTAFDRGGIKDVSQRRPAVPELRLADMDRDGVHAHVIFGPVTSINLEDQELRDACYRVYNDWLADYCSTAPDRLIGVAMLPEYPESATEELRRLAAQGVLKQANLQIAVAKPGLHDPRWEPFWDAVEETGMILSFHVVVFLSGRAPNPASGKPQGFYIHAKSFVSQFIDPFVDLFAWGILERHPKMKIVIAESGVGWLPWLVEELDHRHEQIWEGEEFWAGKGGIVDLKEKPSDLFKRHIYATFQDSPTAIALMKFYGPENLLWASDYPHPDSVWPNSKATIERQMGHLSPEEIRKLTYENAAKLYGLNASARSQAEVAAAE